MLTIRTEVESATLDWNPSQDCLNMFYCEFNKKEKTFLTVENVHHQFKRQTNKKKNRWHVFFLFVYF